jgi:hypothetical protein
VCIWPQQCVFVLFCAGFIILNDRPNHIKIKASVSLASVCQGQKFVLLVPILRCTPRIETSVLLRAVEAPGNYTESQTLFEAAQIDM